MIEATADTGRIGMLGAHADALASFRHFNYDHVYLRQASKEQAAAVIRMLQALVEHYATVPGSLPDAQTLEPSSDGALHAAVAYVGGMTDRFACRLAVSELGWDVDRLPQGIDTHG